MTRVISPNYPGIGLKQAIVFANKIHESVRQQPITPKIALQHLGFPQRSGTSDRVLSALIYFGLTEKAARGEIRVSDLTLQITLNDNRSERLTALKAAAFHSEFFRRLQAKFPDVVPSESSLKSYLRRLNFAPTAVNLASGVYLGTCNFLQKEGVYENDHQNNNEHPVIDSISKDEAHPIAQVDVNSSRADTSSPSGGQPVPTPSLVLNQPKFIIEGNTLRIEALLDFDGVAQFEPQLVMLKTFIKPTKLSGASSGS